MSELRTDSREWVHRIMGSLDRMLVGIENLAVGNRPVTVETEQTYASGLS